MHKKMIKFVSVLLVLFISLSMVSGCASKEDSTGDIKQSESINKNETVTLKYWTWFPNADQFQETITKFEERNPNIKIELTAMESKAYQEKLPVALATGEELDLVGVQPTAMAGQIKTYLAELEPLMEKYISPDWANNYSKADLEASKSLTGDTLYMLAMVRCGAMIGYYNAKMLNDFGLKVPKTFDEFKTFSEKIRAKDSSILPVSFAAKEAWVADEMMLTIMGQTSDYYNQWRYNGSSVDHPHYINAINDYKKFFDAGIFPKEIMDLDYGRAYEMFATGKAATFFQGTWEGGLLSKPIRESKKIDLEDVGVFALPVVRPDGKPSLRSYLDAGIAVVKSTQYEKESTEFLNYVVLGEGIDLLAKHFIGTPGKLNFQMDESLLTSKAAREGFDLMTELVQNPTADRNNVSGYSDVEGAAVQAVVLGEESAENIVKSLQKEWTSGKYSQ